MSDPTDTGQRNPLSSSSSHAGGTSARSISVQSDQQAQDVVAAPASLSHGEADPVTGIRHDAEAGADTESEIWQPEAAGSSDELAAEATEQQDATLASEAQEAQPAAEAVADAHAEYSQAAEELAEEAALAPADEPLTAASIDSTVDAEAEVSAFTDETPAADDEPADTIDSAADSDAASAETQSEDDAAPDAPLENDAAPDAVAELRAAARQKLAENEARQEKALALFDQVSRRFTAALEEAGVDAARVTFKVMEFAQASLKNNLELAKSYTAVRSVPDIFGLHAAYLTRQFELLNAQAEELREITAKFGVRNAAAMKPLADPAETLDDR